MKDNKKKVSEKSNTNEKDQKWLAPDGIICYGPIDWDYD